MSILSQHDADELLAHLDADATTSHSARAEFLDAPLVIIPRSEAGLVDTLRLASAGGQNVFLRSGESISDEDVVTDSNGALVVSTEAFAEVELDGQQLRVGAAATVGAAYERLWAAGLTLPLGDNPSRSLISTLLNPPRGLFPRSAPISKTARDFVQSARLIPTDESVPTAIDVEQEDLREFLSGERNGAFVSIRLQTLPLAPGKWTRVWVVTCAAERISSVVVSLTNQPVLAEVDVSIGAVSAGAAMKVVVVRASGLYASQIPEVDGVVDEALTGAKCLELSVETAQGEAAAQKLWNDTGSSSVTAPHTGDERYTVSNVAVDTDAFRTAYDSLMEFAMGVDDDDEYKAPNLTAWVDVQLLGNGHIQVFGRIVPASLDDADVLEARQLMKNAGLTPIPSTNGSYRGNVGMASVQNNWSVLLEAPPLIDGYEGQPIRVAGKTGYRSATTQYASSSYDPLIRKRRMGPALVAYPKDTASVAACVTHAIKDSDNPMNVVARSGGHQYCGLSSGGIDTLLIDLSMMAEVKLIQPNTLSVQPGAKLAELSKLLRDNGLTIPHGECPGVGIGGHVQTGGVGHQLRTLGLAQDYVLSFEMVTVNAEGKTVTKTYDRPSTDPPAVGEVVGEVVGEGVTDDDVFRAVLGGGPGSWGIITSFKFTAVQDSVYPEANGLTSTFKYRYQVLLEAMQQLHSWATLQHNSDLPAGRDLFVSAVSGQKARPALVMVESMAIDAVGTSALDAVRAAVWDKCKHKPFGKLPGGRKEALSQIAHDGVRKSFFQMPEGREFLLPYKKALYVTEQPFDKSFCKKFVDLVHKTHRTRGLSVAMQAALGGGKFATPDVSLTHMQRRNALVQLVFDVFYDTKKGGTEKMANEKQAEMRDLLTQFSGGKDLRMFWGTFENSTKEPGQELNMENREVRDLYYDTPETYARLQKIKAHVDPNDVFRTSFTVRPWKTSDDQ